MSKSLPILYMLLSLGTAACASANVTSIAPPEYLDWLKNLKKEMADEVLHNFMREMKDLGFKKDDIIVRITDYKEERE